MKRVFLPTGLVLAFAGVFVVAQEKSKPAPDPKPKPGDTPKEAAKPVEKPK